MAKETFTIEITLPTRIFADAADTVSCNIEEYIGDIHEHFKPSTTKVTKALAVHENFAADVREYLTNFIKGYVDDCDWYSLDADVESHLKTLFPKEWEQAVARKLAADAARAAQFEAQKAAQKMAKSSKRIQIFVPKETKGFTAELAALLDKYDGKLAEDLA